MPVYKLYNETGLRVIGLQKNVIDAPTSTGSARNESVLIPRIIPHFLNDDPLIS